MASLKKPVKCGEDYLRDKNWKPLCLTLKGAQRLADKFAKKKIPKGRWHGVVFNDPDVNYYRINIGAKV